MTEPSVVSCRWASQTLLLPYPIWLHSEQHPWTCIRGGVPRLLDDTDVCRDCPNWEPLGPEAPQSTRSGDDAR
jgi:hypothetical protein